MCLEERQREASVSLQGVSAFTELKRISMPFQSIFAGLSGSPVDLLSSAIVRRRRLFNSAVFVFLLLPVLLIGAFNYRQTYNDLTDNASDRRQALAYLAAATLRQRLDYMKDIGVALATRVRFRQLVADGKWSAAIEILRTIPKNFPFIERLFLTDPSGTLMVDTPELSDVRGKNFAFRDWYRGVSHAWQPYVSDAYQRTAEPRHKVVAVAVPVRDEAKIVGILVLQVQVGSLIESRLNTLDIGGSGFIYIVDRRGHLVAHPKFAGDRDSIDFSSVPVVRKVLSGQRGVESGWNPVEKEARIAAYEPVAGYGWGIVAQQPAAEAFAVRDASLRRILIAYGLISLLAVVLALMILRITAERRSAAERLHQKEESFRVFISRVKDYAILMLDADGNIMSWNEGAERIKGYRAEEIIGRHISLFYTREDYERGHVGDLLKLAAEQGRVEEEGWRVRKDGRRFWADVVITAIRDENAVLQGFAKVMRDLTERKQQEDALLGLNEQLIAVNKELEAFTYSVSHDLRAPLRAVDGFSRILLEKYGAEMSSDAKRYQNLIRDNARQMGQLIDDLLSFSRLSRQPVKRQEVEPSEIVRQVLHELQVQSFEQASVTVKDLAVCNADPALLKQVYVNLISNALKYTRRCESPLIEVGCHNDNGTPVYYVRDNGVGFDMKYADKLFGVFQRLHRAEEYEGTGVGLAIVQRVIHRHGGRIWAEADVDQGATFFFTLKGSNHDANH